MASVAYFTTLNPQLSIKKTAKTRHNYLIINNIRVF